MSSNQMPRYTALMRAFLFVTLLALPGILCAHGAGVSFEQVVGDYVVDVGYDPAQPVSGDRLIFDFNLLSPVTSTNVPFDYVWVRLEHQTRTLLATGIVHAEYGPTSLLFTVPRDVTGDLTVKVRYQQSDDTLAEATFQLPVAEQRKVFKDFAPLIGAIAAGLAAGLAAAIVFMKFRPRVV